MIDCRETLLRFYDYLDRELPDLQAREVEEHLAACRPCFDRMEFERNFSRFLHRECCASADVAELKAKILERLQSVDGQRVTEVGTPFDGPPSRHGEPTLDHPTVPLAAAPRSRAVPAWSYVLVAASALLLVWSVWLAVPKWFSGAATLPGELAPLAAIHSTASPQFRHSEAPALADWIRLRAPHESLAGDLDRAGCTLRGASVDSIWTVVFATCGGLPVTFFVAGEAEFSIPAGLRAVTREGRVYQVAEAGGLTVLMWSHKGGNLVCAAVADSDAESLLPFVMPYTNSTDP